jgi:hypothetical protein
MNSRYKSSQVNLDRLCEQAHFSPANFELDHLKLSPQPTLAWLLQVCSLSRQRDVASRTRELCCPGIYEKSRLRREDAAWG